MSVRLPLRPDLTHYDFQVALDDVSYTFEFRWNTRESAWYMGIFTEDGDPILTSVKVVSDYTLALRSRDVRMPPGLLISTDTSGSKTDPGLTDLGDRVQIIYFSPDELPLS